MGYTNIITHYVLRLVLLVLPAAAAVIRAAALMRREFAKGGLVKGGLAIYVLLLYHYC